MVIEVMEPAPKQKLKQSQLIQKGPVDAVSFCRRASHAKGPKCAVRDDPDTFAVQAQGTVTIFCACGYWGGGDFEVNKKQRAAGSL
jgi:hypothetical protein